MILGFAGVGIFLLLVIVVVAAIIGVFVLGAGMGRERRTGATGDEGGRRPQHTRVRDDPEGTAEPER